MALHIPFENLPSPILFRGDEHIAYRDPAAVVADGWLHLFFTLVETEPDGGVYMYLGKTKSRDLLHWEPVRKLSPRARHLNYSSPGNIVRYGGRWVLCLQTYCRENGEKYGNENCRIFVMESDDLETFDSPRLLRVKGDVPVEAMGRMIDPYLLRDAQDAEKWWCFYKQNGVSMSYSRDLQHWTFAGSADFGENVCVIPTKDGCRMFHSPHNGIGVADSTDCLHWRDTGTLLTLGQKDWLWARGRITAGFVLDVTGIFAKEPTWLMLFHGTGPQDESVDFDRNASIGLAWSHDLERWHWPGEAGAATAGCL